MKKRQKGTVQPAKYKFILKLFTGDSIVTIFKNGLKFKQNSFSSYFLYIARVFS